MFAVTQQWASKAQEALQKPVQAPAEAVAEDRQQTALKRLREAAEAHRHHIQRGAEAQPGPDGMVAEHLVVAILSAGAALDRAIAHALDLGLTVEEITGEADIHPLYVEELMRNPF